MIDYQHYGDYQFVEMAEAQAASQLEQELVKRLKDVIESRDNMIKNNDDLYDENCHLNDVVNWIGDDYDDLYDEYDQSFFNVYLLMIDYISTHMGNVPTEFAQFVNTTKQEADIEKVEQFCECVEEFLEDHRSIEKRLPLFEDFVNLVSYHVDREDHDHL